MPQAHNRSPVIRLEGVARDFFDGRQIRRVLRPVTLDFQAGEFTIVSGPSGSGKTTLLTIMALILDPSEGRLFVNGRDVTALSDDAKATIRLRHYGFVFQNAALIPALSVLENVLIAHSVQGAAATTMVQERSKTILERLGMGGFLHMKADKLSAGQKQRVAIGRALINEPGLILCDEPTASLDVDSSTTVLGILKELSRENRAVVLVTHDPRVFPYADRLVAIEDGTVVTDTGTSPKAEGRI